MAGQRNRILLIAILAACFLLIAGLMARNRAGGEKPPQITVLAAGSPAPGGRKMLNYNGARYVFLGDGAQYDLSGLALTRQLGVLEQDYGIGSEEGGADMDLAATFAPGGILYEMPGYSPDFRVAVLHQGACYIAQFVDSLDGSPVELSRYLDMAGLAENAQGAEIRDHMGAKVLKTLSGKDARDVAAALGDAALARPTSAEYEAIASAQSQGQSYLLSFALGDGTAVDFYSIPSLGYLFAGDGRYRLSQTFRDRYGPLFDGLEQKPPPQG